MESISKYLCATAVLITIGAVPAFATNYSGDGYAGFGGVMGPATLAISDDVSTGLILFSLTNTTSNSFSNDAVFYFDTENGGGGIGTSTANMTDFGDDGRVAISGDGPAGTGGTRSLVTFAGTFSPEYAICMDGGAANLFLLNNNASLTYLSTLTSSGLGTDAPSFSINATALGLTVGTGASFSFVATYANGGDAGGDYLSNEAIGPVTSTPSNPGNGGTLTFTGFDSYTLGTAVPEPSDLAMMMACSVFGGLYLIRRRRSVTRSEEKGRAFENQ